MPTHSRIATQEPDGRGGSRIRSIYCHFDGYPECIGTMLLAHYTEPAKVRALIDLGDLSYLGSDIAYGHDRKEKRVEAQEHSGDPKELLQAARDCRTKYTYLYREHRWHLVEQTGARVLLTPLDEVLEKLLGHEEAPHVE